MQHPFQPGHSMTCDDCGVKIGEKKNGVEITTLYISPEGNEVVPHVLDGRPVMAAVGRETCLPCYTAAFKRVHPKTPVPELKA